MATIFTTRLNVRSYELDSFGHVNNATYLNYLEYARGDYLRQRGLSFADFHQWDAMPYVIRVEISYRASCRVHDDLEIRGWISAWSRTGFVMSYELFNHSSGRLAAEAQMKFAFVNQLEKVVRIPAPFREKMQ